MGIWNFKISEDENYEFGTDMTNCLEPRFHSGWHSVTQEPRFYLLGEKKVSEVLSESTYKDTKYLVHHEWCNKYDEWRGPYDIIIFNNRMQSTLDVKTRCLKYISLEEALKTWTVDIDKSKIENPVDYYICCVWNKKSDILHIVGWIERKEVIKLIENNEIKKEEKKYESIKTNELFYEPVYKIPLNKFQDMETLFLKLGIKADFAKYDGQKTLDF